MGHLPISTYLEQHIEVYQHYAIRSFMPGFAAEVKQKRLDEAAARGEKPWIAWTCGAWRIVYFEADRQLMDIIFAESATRARLTHFLQTMKPVGLIRERPPRQSSRRDGPYSAGGGSVHATAENVNRFFGIPVGAV